jgi:hypothetical protein
MKAVLKIILYDILIQLNLMHSIYIQFNNTFKLTPKIPTGSFDFGFSKQNFYVFLPNDFYIWKISWVIFILEELDLRNSLTFSLLTQRIWWAPSNYSNFNV